MVEIFKIETKLGYITSNHQSTEQVLKVIHCISLKLIAFHTVLVNSVLHSSRPGPNNCLASVRICGKWTQLEAYFLFPGQAACSNP